MKKIILASVLSLALLVAFGSGAVAEMAKEGTDSGTAIYSGSIKVLAMGKERLEMTYELMGVYLSDTGQGLLHNASYRVLGKNHVVKGMYKGSGSIVFTRPDGDQAFMTYVTTTGKLGVGSKATFTYVGGTGKLTDIEGSGEWTNITVRPVAEGTIQGIVKSKDHWKLP